MGFWNKLISSLTLKDDDEAYEAYNNEEEESVKPAAPANQDKYRPMEKPVSSASNATPKSAPYRDTVETKSENFNVKKVHNMRNYGTSTYIESRNNNKTLRMERPGESKVVPIKTIKSGIEVCVMKPHNFEESQDICDVLLSSCCAIINLEENDIELSRRIMDFMYGVVYSIDGKLIQISDFIFIVAPENVDVSGDCRDILAQTGYDIPSLNERM